MAHSLSSVSATATAALACSTRFTNKRCSCLRLPNVQARSSANAYNEPPRDHLFSRRNAALILTGAMLGLSVADRSAEAAARRPPPSPPQEKKDPNVSGVQAKVLASKKRKEAMKEAMAKLREKGKAVDQAPPPPPPPPPPVLVPEIK